MSKPAVFQKLYVALHHIPYVGGEGSSRDDVGCGGVICRGQTVWAQDNFEHERHSDSTVVFVEGIGIISLDPRWLVRADILNPGHTLDTEPFTNQATASENPGALSPALTQTTNPSPTIHDSADLGRASFSEADSRDK